MSWGRIDDREVLDPKIGQLTDREYRAHKALIQYVLRERRNTGTFHPKDIRHAIYDHPNGPRAVKPKELERFKTLGLVRPLDTYTDAEIASFLLGNVANSSPTLLRINRWEVYNPDRSSLEERVAGILKHQPKASANDVYRMLGGNRNAVLASVQRYRNGINGRYQEPPQEPVSNPVSDTSTDTGMESGIARAVPSRPLSTSSPSNPSVLQGPDDFDLRAVLRDMPE